MIAELTTTGSIDRGEVLISGMAAMLITLFLGPRFIEYLRVKEFGQQIREEGPEGHHSKAGTPTMGGLVIFLAVLVPYLVLSNRDWASLAVFGAALVAAGVGFADDWIKVSKRRSLGLSGRWKILAQLAIALGIWAVALGPADLEPQLTSRILFGGELYLGPVGYFVLIFLVIAGASNGVNLSDGLDGLAAGSCAIVLLAYMAISITIGLEGLALISACLIGASVGFLWFNAFPASIFMGDTGSLGLGAAIGALAVMTQTELLLVILGGIFVIEALSVAIQVIWFKSTRKRVFLMAPIHHHFEMLAWSETKIMLRFWIVAAVCGGTGYVLFQNSLG
ncbi:phospho-N-acetylmuramoyl-pentapeptide-transferase [Thermoleophilia bacterium SCSIO 60948]|nr:phospho-N-acetylmuramoyl-pentapeptide-transferase [Thermoleophilia bacterium SCSIO 60948]